MNFHGNDSLNKVAKHCKEANIHFEYTNFWDKDEETFKSAKNITALKKIFKQKSLLWAEKEKLYRRLRQLKKKRPKRGKKMLEG